MVKIDVAAVFNIFPTSLGKSCSFGLPQVSFGNFCQCIDGGMWDLVVLIPDQCLSVLLCNGGYHTVDCDVLFNISLILD